MTDEDDQALSPEEETRIRSALAAGRATEPTPDHVVARLDATLADLVAGRDGTRESSGPAGRRPRRTGRWLLLAGAASVAAIAAFTIPSMQAGHDDLTSAKSGAGSADSGNAPRSARPGSESQADGATTDQQVVRLSSGSFGADVRRQIATIDSLGTLTKSTRRFESLAGQKCGLTRALPPGVVERQPVLLDDAPAVLEVFASRDGTRLVRAVSCGVGKTLASARIPAP